MWERDGNAPGATRRSRGLKRRMTWTEQRLWKELRRLDANFRRQAPIGRYFADFACHAQRLIIEVDGRVHERLPDVMARDVERQRWLEGQGYRVLRVTDRQVSGDVFALVAKIEALLLDGGGLGGGVASETREGRWSAPAPKSAIRPIALRSPPSPTLPPSRRKGAPDRLRAGE